MRIGCFVEDDAHVGFLRGLIRRWFPEAKLEEPKIRGHTKQSLRREMKDGLLELVYKRCDYLVVLRDSDSDEETDWRKVKQEAWAKVPDTCQHFTIFGVPHRNIECWLAADRSALAQALGCSVDEISIFPPDNPSDFVKARFLLGTREIEETKQRIETFVANAPLRLWIRDSPSFADFWNQVWKLSRRDNCGLSNEKAVRPRSKT